MNNKKVYAVIGIGIGPFNLGLAALLEPVTGLSSIFFDQSDSFNWHPGLMLDQATLQVPFLGDLVTMADPTNPYTFLNYLKETGRIYRFYIRENFFIFRKEYNAYCKWAVSKLSNCRFSHQVSSISYIDGLYELTVTHTRTGERFTFYAEKLVLGTGTLPSLPAFANTAALPRAVHTSNYLYVKDELLRQDSVTIIGSGQSAAEVFNDLLPHTKNGLKLNWFTRSSHFFPLDNKSKLTLELTSPEYADHFYSLPYEKRMQLLVKQAGLYKGIDQELINGIFDSLYEMSLESENVNVELRPNMRLDRISVAADGRYNLHFEHTELQKSYEKLTDFVLLATGYSYKEPGFISGINDRIQRLDNGRYAVNRNYSIDKNGNEVFVQNAELHTHGLVTPDLGMGAYRNSCIINQIAGKEIYQVEKRIAFQQFGIHPSDDEHRHASELPLQLSDAEA